ncbi:unnamed protein product [Peronospora belbahrii]|uniref:FYVE-type domain-containing protein n=1 Tax=Peronospora belbahrii TaxID=622444 RepID=A0AAU9L850_9STRA|nr:unnamed protein product [Peronospora belbahrii]
MRFDSLRTRSVSARRPVQGTERDTIRLHRGHSVMPEASTTPLSHTIMRRPMTRRQLFPSSSSDNTSEHSHSDSSVLPPIDELFPRSELDPRMKKHLVRVANGTSNALIKDTLMPDERGSVLWRPAQRPRGAPSNIHVLRGAARDVSEAKDATCVRAVSDDVHASIEEFALLFKLDSSREAADHLLLFNADLMQHSTLYTLVSPSGQQPRRYVGIKWALVASPSRFFRNRDFCYLECQKEFTDAKGRRGWVRSLHSLKMPCCPSLEKEHGIVRASIYRSGLTAVETDDPGVLSVTYTVELDLKGRMALELLQPGFLAQRVAALASVDKLLQQQRLSSSPLLGDLDIPTKKRMRGSCNLCFRQFVASGGLRDTLAAITNMSTRSTRYVCRKCGEGVCRRCSDDWWLDVPVVGRTKVRICTVCSAEAKQSHISAHTTRAGTCPIRLADKAPTTEVEGITHPNLLTAPPQRRSLSMLDRASDATSFFAQQEEIKRDLELRATELNQRVKVWDAMQVYDRDFSLQPDKQQPVQSQVSRKQRERKMEQRERKVEQPFSVILSSKLAVQEEVKEEPEAGRTPQHQQVRDDSSSMSERPSRQRRLDSCPSFMSSEVSSNQELSDTENDDITRVTVEAGAQLSLNYRDSSFSDYEEHTIDGLGEIRTTTDVTSWWQDQQQRSSVVGEEEQYGLGKTLVLIPSPRMSERDASVVEHEGKSKMCQRQGQAAPMASAEKQEMADMFNHWKQESTAEIQHRKHSNNSEQQRQLAEFEEQAQYQEEQVRRRQQSDFEEMAQYQEEQARRRRQSLGPPVLQPEYNNKCQLTASALQQIQQHQKELAHLHCNGLQPTENDPLVVRAQSSVQISLDLQSTLAVKERYLQKQRQQQLNVAAEKQSRIYANEELGQSAGEDVELMESSQGEWVPINEARIKKANAMTGAFSKACSPRHGPGLCSTCGSREYMGQNGMVRPRCKCSANPASPTTSA